MLVKQPFSEQPISLAYLSLLGLEETDFHTLQFYMTHNPKKIFETLGSFSKFDDM